MTNFPNPDFAPSYFGISHKKPQSSDVTYANVTMLTSLQSCKKSIRDRLAAAAAAIGRHKHEINVPFFLCLQRVF
jgi:hypothetical protein